MTSDEFAGKIKQKYPEYQSLSNQDLTSKMLAKYPQYQSQVQTDPMAGFESGASSVMRGLGLGAVPNAISALTTAPSEIGAAFGGQQAKQKYAQDLASNPFTDPRVAQGLQDKNMGEVTSGTVGATQDSSQGFTNAMGLATDAQGALGVVKALPLLTKRGAVTATTKAVQQATTAGKAAKWDDIASEIRNAVKSQYGNSVEHARAVNKFLAQEVPAKLGNAVTKTPNELLTLRKQILARSGTGNIIQKLMNVKTTEDQVAGVARNVVSKYVHQLAPESQVADKAYTMWKKIGGSPAEWAARAAIGGTVGKGLKQLGIPESGTTDAILTLLAGRII